ncbi:MAG: hypothetical protein CVU05_11445 [Bacteroidetes bacterium HGW-Bacteroidetes-21]|jgi:hypothetical protein|nr:MAG: hypothetical protein CVU05_11445 [Bacteroidetes bacterium HGW-Bacteroidetes-21]
MKTFLIIIILFLGCKLYAQDKKQAFIEVIGSAEMSVVPNDVELEIVLNFPGSSKSSEEEMEKKFFDVLEKHNIPKMAVSFVSVSNPYYWYYWWWEYRHHYNTKTYKIRIDCTKYDFSFIKDLNPEYIQSIRITQSSHSKITEYRRQVKVEAMIAAKEKASVLLESIGQKLGGALEIIEMPEPIVNSNIWYNPYGNQNYTSNSIISQPSSGINSQGGESYVPSIKLRFEIKARFEIL